MIDEDLYQQAADELNSDRRRSALWARACALASDDHDEARFLYTNLRVEELLAEDRSAKSATSYEEEDADATLALEPLDATITEGKPVGFLDEFEPSDSTGTPQSFAAPAGVDDGSAKDEFLSLDQPIDHEPDPDPDATLMEGYVPEMRSDFDDTFEGTSLVSDDDVAVALEEVARENQEPTHDSSTSDGSNAKTVTDSSNNEGFTNEGLAEAIANAKSKSDDYSAVYNEEDAGDLTQVADMTHAYDQTQSSDLTQANVQVFDEHSDELDGMLANMQQSTEETGAVEDVAEDMSWLDNDDVTQRPVTPKTAAVVDHEEDPIVLEDNAFANELNRQADELGFHAPDHDLASMKQDLEDQARVFEEPDSSYISQRPARDEFLPEEPEAQDQDSLENEPDKAISVVGTGATAAVAAAGIASAPDLSEPVTREYGEKGDLSSPVSNTELELPLDLTSGRKGSEYEIYRRDIKAQAVRSGVSWSALFLTFPYLVYRHLFGTAIVYAILWIISLSGLAIASLAWVDAGTAVTPLIQACTIGFALIAFIGLIYLPFRYGNRWRAEKLENRGYELVATTKAPSPGKAIARARRHAALLD